MNDTAVFRRLLLLPLMATGTLLVASLAIGVHVDARTGLWMVIGGLFGMVLYHAAFGFTAAWRVFITERRGRGLRAQTVMLAIAVTLFFPALGAGNLFGTPIYGFVAPIGVSVVMGAFLFGVGMQLGGGCGSGTLFTAGGGNVRMLVTLLFLIVGSLVGTAHFSWWQNLPAIAPVSLIHTAGPLGGILLSLALFAGISALTVWMERRRHGRIESAPGTTRGIDAG